MKAGSGFEIMPDFDALDGYGEMRGKAQPMPAKQEKALAKARTRSRPVPRPRRDRRRRGRTSRRPRCTKSPPCPNAPTYGATGRRRGQGPLSASSMTANWRHARPDPPRGHQGAKTSRRRPARRTSTGAIAPPVFLFRLGGRPHRAPHRRVAGDAGRTSNRGACRRRACAGAAGVLRRRRKRPCVACRHARASGGRPRRQRCDEATARSSAASGPRNCPSRPRGCGTGC